ncbi:ABATE domain-containing protein [Streptomyces sp. ZYX-F-203]
MAPGSAVSADASRLDTGRVCLDLMATAHPRERLRSARALRAWIIGRGLVPAGTDLSHVDASWPAAFRELRAHTARLLVNRPVPDPAYDRALAHVNALARANPPVLRAVPGGEGALIRESGETPGLAAMLAVPARDAVDLLTDPAARAALRRCQGVGCRIVYLDTSRGRRRRWCRSETCGNRERVARHRRRAAGVTRERGEADLGAAASDRSV